MDTRVEIHASTRRGHVFWISIGQYEQVTSVLDTIGEMHGCLSMVTLLLDTRVKACIHMSRGHVFQMQIQN